MPIENRNLKPGTKLVGRYHKQTYSCEVVEGEGGKLRYRLAGRTGVQEPLGSGDGHHRTCLRRLGLLERGDDRDCSCTGCTESRSRKGTPSTRPRMPRSRRRRRSRLLLPPRNPARPRSASSGYPIRKVCRKARPAGTATTAARAS